MKNNFLLFKAHNMIIVVITMTILLLTGCVGDNNGNSQLQNQPQQFSINKFGKSQLSELPINLAWSIDGESQVVANLKDMGWHVLTATVESIGNESGPISVPVKGIIYQIDNISTPGLIVSVQDINCNNAVFTKVGDSCSAYFKMSYGESASGQYLAQATFATGSLPLIPGQTVVTDKINTQYSVADYRIIMPIESAYYQANMIAKSPTEYQMISVENGGIIPINITNLTSPSNTNFAIVNRTTNTTSDPYYGPYNECVTSANVNPDFNQISQLTNLNESCIVVYQANESANTYQENSTVSLNTDASWWFPYNVGTYSLQAYYGTGPQIIWESTTLPSSNFWSSVVYGNNEFVAIAPYSNVGAVSTDGVTWTKTILPYKYPSSVSLTYGNGKFVIVGWPAIGGSTPIGVISTDGVTWTETTLPGNNQKFNSVTYGNGKFVAVGEVSPTVDCTWVGAISSDGINWTTTTMPSLPECDGGWLAVTYGNNEFVAISSYADKAAVSTDGINWTETTLPPNNSWLSLTYGNGKFVVTGFNTNNYLDSEATSTDGINWIPINLPSNLAWSAFAITYGNGVFMALPVEVNASGIFGSNIGAVSKDGINWEDINLPIESQLWTSITSGDKKFVAVGITGFSPCFCGSNIGATGVYNNVGGSLNSFIISNYSGY